MEALLEAAQALAAARDLARYGEWYRFLEVTQTSAATAERLLNIHRLATQNLQFAGLVRDNWIGVSVAGLLARPSTPPIVIERVTAEQIVPTIEAVQSAIDAVEEQAAAPPFDPAEHQAAAAAEFHALDDEIRDATAKPLRKPMHTACASPIYGMRFDRFLMHKTRREKRKDRATELASQSCVMDPVPVQPATSMPPRIQRHQVTSPPELPPIDHGTRRHARATTRATREDQRVEQGACG